jgi:hypothetical protein
MDNKNSLDPSKQKNCKCGGAEWKTRDEFLKDESVKLTGYEANLDTPALGVLLFNHACGAVIPMHAEHFKDLHNGTKFTERKTGSKECPRYCHDKNELSPCTEQCECAWVREVIQLIRGNKDVLR